MTNVAAKLVVTRQLQDPLVVKLRTLLAFLGQAWL